jgi:hypothetical protein
MSYGNTVAADSGTGGASATAVTGLWELPKMGAGNEGKRGPPAGVPGRVTESCDTELAMGQ